MSVKKTELEKHKQKNNPSVNQSISVFTWWSVSDSDQLQVVRSLLQRGLQDLLVLLLLLQQLLQQPAGGTTATVTSVTKGTGSHRRTAWGARFQLFKGVVLKVMVRKGKNCTFESLLTPPLLHT